jgi:hypothetical protein
LLISAGHQWPLDAACRRGGRRAWIETKFNAFNLGADAARSCPNPVGKHVSNLNLTYALSDGCGIRRMRRECIRSTPSWRNQGARRDCAFVVEDQEKPRMKGLSVVRVKLLFLFEHRGKVYPCALVEWFKTMGRSPDRDTGRWKASLSMKVGNVCYLYFILILFFVAHTFFLF